LDDDNVHHKNNEPFMEGLSKYKSKGKSNHIYNSDKVKRVNNM